jgi:hypothetical protein
MERQLEIEYVRNIDLSKIGKIISIPEEGSMTPLLESSSFRHYGPLGYLVCSDAFELGIATFNKRDFIVQQLEQHVKTQELCFAIDGDFVMPVAPTRIIDGAEYPDEESIMAIHVKTGEGVIFDKGTWHGAPYPYGDRKQSSVLVLFKKDTVTTDITFRELSAKYTLVK